MTSLGEHEQTAVQLTGPSGGRCRRRWRELVSIAAAGTLALAAGCSSGGSSGDGEPGGLKDVTVITDVLTTVYTPLYTAEKLGFFEKHGLNVQINTLESGATITAVMQSGSVDIAASGAITQALAVKQGASFIAIASEGNASPEVCARPGWIQQHNLTSTTPIEQIFGAFRGARFGVTGIGGTPDLLMQYLVRTYGNLDPAQDMETIALGSPAGVATAFKQEAIDVTLASPPQCEALVAAGTAQILLKPSQIPAFQDLPYAVIYSTKSYIEENPDVARAFAASIVEALQYAHANPDDVIKNVLQPYFPQTPVETLSAALNDVILPQMPKDGRMSKEGWDKVADVVGPVSGNPLDTTEGSLWTNEYLPG